jgi:hypothetical protein
MPRRGSALVSVVLLLLATTLLAMGALHLARAERVAAAASARESRLDAVVQGWVDAVLRGWAAGSLDSLPRDVAHEVDQARVRVRLETLDREWVLARGWGAAHGPSSTKADPLSPSRHARVAWAADPGARAAAWSAALEHGGPLRAGPGAGILAPPNRERLPGGCGVPELVLDTLVGSRSRRGARRVPMAPEGPALGLLDLEDLADRLDAVAPGRSAPTSVMVGGVCADVPTNWGAPSAPSGGCGGRWVGRYADGDLAVVRGEGQGVLVVRGDLELGPRVLFRGVLLVGGSLRLGPDARVHGLARVAEGVTLEAGARIEGGFCPASRALAEAADLGTPLLGLPGSRVGRP